MSNRDTWEMLSDEKCRLFLELFLVEYVGISLFDDVLIDGTNISNKNIVNQVRKDILDNCPDVYNQIMKEVKND